MGKGLVFISGEIVYVYKNEIKMILWKLDTETKFIIIMTLEVHLWIIVFWMQVLLKHVNENRNSYRRNVFYICRVSIGLDLSVLVTKCTPFFLNQCFIIYYFYPNMYCWRKYMCINKLGLEWWMRLRFLKLVKVFKAGAFWLPYVSYY